LWFWLSPAARLQTAGFPPELFSRAERTNHQETSQHKDILEFVDTVRKLSPFVHAEEFAVSQNGKPLPLVVISTPG
jgi:hypothetical protein